MRILVPCPHCGRHVFAGDSSCPFCASALPADLARFAVPGTSRRLTRAAAFAFTASLSVLGCSSDSTGPVDAGHDANGGADGPAYGLPPVLDSGNDAMPQDAGPGDAGGNQVLYGLPPSDAAAD